MSEYFAPMEGDRIMIKYFINTNEYYKHGEFLGYSKRGKFGYFKDDKTGKILKRKCSDFMREVANA